MASYFLTDVVVRDELAMMQDFQSKHLKTRCRMSSKPMPLGPADWAEIDQLEELRQGWGLEDGQRFEGMSEFIYAAKFNFVSGCPGYCGDLYVLQGDALTGDPPVVLTRDSNGKLRVSSWN